MYLKTGIQFTRFAAQLCSPVHQLHPLAVQGRCQRALVLEGFLAKAGQALVWGMERCQCVSLSHLSLQ